MTHLDYRFRNSQHVTLDLTLHTSHSSSHWHDSYTLHIWSRPTRCHPLYIHVDTDLYSKWMLLRTLVWRRNWWTCRWEPLLVIRAPKIHISRTKNNNESSHNENIELLHERRDKLTNLAASSENLANKTQQYRDNMKAVNKTMARRYRLSNRRLTIVIVVLSVLVVVALVVAVVVLTNKP